MILLHNFVQVMENYAVFEGRASRSEFWWFILAIPIVAFIIGRTCVLPIIPYS